MTDRRADFNKMAVALDITPTMYQNAVEKYQTVAKHIEASGVHVSIYPQGSFRLGTVVRPYRDGKELDYDLDVVCELSIRKEDTSPQAVKESIGNMLARSEAFRDKLKEEDDRCWTLQYALVDGEIGFELDLVPSVHQNTTSIDALIRRGVPINYANAAISITERVGGIYRWQDSNPGGYAAWFDAINAPFAKNSSLAERQRLFENNRRVFASVESIPPQLERSALQRVIQILKRHRDIYYTTAKKWDIRPISAIITTLAAQIASHARSNLEVSELLSFVSRNLIEFRTLLEGKEPAGVFAEARKYLTKDEQQWKILNPVNPNDNYADSWDDATAEMFFRWLSVVYRDFIEALSADEARFISNMKNGLGHALVESVFPQKLVTPTVRIQTATKPYGGIQDK